MSPRTRCLVYVKSNAIVDEMAMLWYIPVPGIIEQCCLEDTGARLVRTTQDDLDLAGNILSVVLGVRKLSLDIRIHEDHVNDFFHLYLPIRVVVIYIIWQVFAETNPRNSAGLRRTPRLKQPPVQNDRRPAPSLHLSPSHTRISPASSR